MQVGNRLGRKLVGRGGSQRERRRGIPTKPGSCFRNRGFIYRHTELAVT